MRNVSVFFFYVVIVFSSIVASSDKLIEECPGLELSHRWGVQVDCMLTTRGVVTFNCSLPMPQETVALYTCRRFFRQTAASSPVKLMRCNQGKWSRMDHFLNLKCEYECGKAQPLTKTLIINDRITTRTIWPWHALIYYKVDIAELDGDLLKPPQSQGQNSSSSSLPSGPEDIDDTPQLVINELNFPSKRSRLMSRSRRSLDNSSSYYEAYICGGTLISPSIILTASHCLTDDQGVARDPRLFSVALGGISNSFYTNRQHVSTQIIKASQLYISSEFKYEQFEGDIGIISLAHNAQLSNIVLPACLPDSVGDSTLFISNGKYGEVIGSRPEIARTSSGGLGLGLSTQLKAKRLHVLSTIDCSRNIDRIPSEKEYCAGRSDEVICSGDSGGGMISSPNFGLRRRYTIQGIVSYARARQLCENYAVFTRVYKFMGWINQIIKQYDNYHYNVTKLN